MSLRVGVSFGRPRAAEMRSTGEGGKNAEVSQRYRAGFPCRDAAPFQTGVLDSPWPGPRVFTHGRSNRRFPNDGCNH